MRIPFSKRYRAFPELDRFSDAECEAFVRLARRKHRVVGFFGTLVTALVGVVLFVLGVFMTAAFASIVSHSRAPSWIPDERWIVLGGVVVSLVLALVFVIETGNVRLRSAIQALLSTLACAGCEYSLLGLPAHDGVIVCPECGQPFNLAARGLSEAEVMARAAESHAS